MHKKSVKLVVQECKKRANDQAPASVHLAMSSKTPEQAVYILQLRGGCAYVGKSSNVRKRLEQHMQGTFKSRAASFTKLHKPTGKLLPRLGNVTGSGDASERDETLRWMHKLGPHKVRGWKFVRRGTLKKTELREIESNCRELFDLCRKCGKDGHFASACKSRTRKK